jgi:hypothetical protein
MAVAGLLLHSSYEGNPYDTIKIMHALLTFCVSNFIYVSKANFAKKTQAAKLKTMTLLFALYRIR